MKNVIKILLITILLISIVGCAQFRRLDPQYPLPNQSTSYQPQEGKTKVIFFNGSNFFLHGLDMTDKIDIVINNKNVGSIRLGEYVVIDLIPGKYQMKLTHYDIGTFSDEYTLEVIEGEMYIKVYNGLISTKFKIVEKLPERFQERYRNYY